MNTICHQKPYKMKQYMQKQYFAFITYFRQSGTGNILVIKGRSLDVSVNGSSAWACMNVECLLWTTGGLNRSFRVRNADIFSFIQKNTPTCQCISSQVLRKHHLSSCHPSVSHLFISLSLSVRHELLQQQQPSRCSPHQACVR